jgi:putative chitinase
MTDPGFYRDVQLLLKRLGHDPGPLDGVEGPATRRALQAAIQGAGIARRLRLTEAFFGDVRVFCGPLREPQVEGFNCLLSAMGAAGWSTGWAAYGFATAFHETAMTMQPIKERGGDAYFHRLYDIEGERPDVAKRLGNLQPGDGVRYAGRGFVQVTGRSNYARFGIDGSPDDALRPDVAAKILVSGMADGMFSGKGLGDYLPAEVGKPEQFVAARKIINGVDRAQQIANYALQFQRALIVGGWA